MSHNLFTDFLKNAFRKAVENDAVSKALLQQKQESRRTFLKNAAALAAGTALIPVILKANSFKKDKNIIIIGGGMAGLNAAYQLQKLGINSKVYEASSRTGGRMFTMKDYFGDGITTDIGGEFVDTSHEDILQLLKEFNLGYYDLRTDTMEPQAFYFEGKLLSEADLAAALRPFIPQLVKDLAALPLEINYKNAGALQAIDDMSITAYLTALGIKGWLYNYLEVMLTREYGMEAAEQSAINFLLMLDRAATNASDTIFSGGHEVFKIKGGSQHLADTLYQKVKERVVLKHRLVAVKKGINNQYEVTFENAGGQLKLKADHIIMALPYTILRTINFEVPMAPEKRKCIDEWGYGNSSKFVIGFKEKPWRNSNKQGYTFTDEAFGCGWDSSHMQSDKAGSFTVFGGGDFSNKVFATNQQQLNAAFVPALQKIYAGAGPAFTGKNFKFCWAKQPFTKGGYTSLKKGQYSTIVGWEAEPVDEIYFAGEHVSGEFQGYMNGAAETGRKAALAIAAKVLLTKKN